MLYRTHKSLPKSQKVSSLYVFDALARAARHQANKHSLPVKEISSDKPGNAGTFLFKLEGILDGLVEDMVAAGTPEAMVSILHYRSAVGEPRNHFYDLASFIQKRLYLSYLN
jgi:protein NRD1